MAVVEGDVGARVLARVAPDTKIVDAIVGEFSPNKQCVVLKPCNLAVASQPAGWVVAGEVEVLEKWGGVAEPPGEVPPP